ncbi:MAG: aminomethyltransferase, partial [Rhodobacteraceae bacterium]|nr:aminomethyltransferase [Paracoccaceae bacterium]
AAMDMLRIEAGLAFAGQEFNDQTDPYEAGIGFTVALRTKNDDFIGREQLAERKAHPRRKLVGLEMESKMVPANGSSVRRGKAQVGEVTSAVRSPILGKSIALARVDSGYAKPGTELDVGQLDGLQKRLRAQVVPFPHFDPRKRRVRGDYGT